MGHTLTVATIHLSLFSYLLAVVCWITGYRGSRYRGLWTAGCVLLVAHAVFAFHFYLGWSHSAAVRLTAEQTEAMLGFSFGNGIWFSYLLLLVWVIDVARLWRNDFRQDEETDLQEAVYSSWFTRAVHAYAFFILFNGTVVFEEGAIRLGGIIGTIWLARLGWRHRTYAAAKVRTTELPG